MATTKSLASAATSRRTGGSAHNTTNRLNNLADNFNHFYGDLEEETTIRKQAEEHRVVRLEREMGKVERVIATETKRRIEASKALQTMFETQLLAMQKELRDELHSTYEPLQAQVDKLAVRVEQIEKTIEEEKQNREAEIKRANAELLAKFSEHVKQFEVEKVARLQREAQTLKRVGDEVFRVQQKIAGERATREAAIVQMKDNFAASVKARDKADEVFKAEMLRKVTAVERDLEVETAAREASEEQLISALNDYTRALQDGLRIVNRAH